MNMGERIRKRRKELGYTQEELGKKVGLQKSGIAKYESGRIVNIKQNMLFKMAHALKCSPSYLIGLDDDHQYTLEQQFMEMFRKLNNDNKQKTITRINIYLEDQDN